MAIDIKLSKRTQKLVKDLAHKYKRYGENVNKATALGMNWLAWDVRLAEQDNMRKRFDKPKPFTLRSVGVDKAKPNDLRASVLPLIAAERYILPNVESGGRRKKRSENLLAGYWHPSKYTTLDQYGNIPGARMNKILADTGRAGDKLQRANARKTKKYFQGKSKNGTRIVFAHYGSMKRTRDGQLYQAYKPELIMTRAPIYRKRLPWFEVGQRVLKAKFDKTMDNAFKKFKF